MGITINGVKVAGAGPKGKSAYEAAKEGGFAGTEQEFNGGLAGFIQTDLKYTKSNSNIDNENVKFSAVAYGNGVYVAVENNETGVIAKSGDGLTWENISSASYSYWSDIIYADGKFVAVGYDPTSLTDVATYATGALYDAMIYSEDGATWTVVDSIKDIGSNWSSIAYGGGKFVVFSIDGTIAAYSTDLNTWQSVTIPVEYNSAMYVTYGNGKFVAVGNCMAFYSDDGVTWTSGNIGNSCVSICFGDNKFVAVCNDGGVVYSADGIGWDVAIQDELYEWSSAAFGNGNFVAVSSSSDVAIVSSDGINWRYKKLPFSAAWTDIVYTNHKYLTVNADNTTTCLIELSNTVDFATQHQLELQTDFMSDRSWTNVELIPYDGEVHTLSEYICNELIPLPNVIDLNLHNYKIEIIVYGLSVAGATSVTNNLPSVCLIQDAFKNRTSISLYSTETIDSSTNVVVECDWPTQVSYSIIRNKNSMFSCISGTFYSNNTTKRDGHNTSLTKSQPDESYYNFVELYSYKPDTTYTYGILLRYRPIL